MNKLSTLLVGSVFALAWLPAQAVVLIDESFDSYTDTADLGATWTLGDGTLDTGFGNPGQSLYHPGTAPSFSGGNTNRMSFSEVAPGAGQTLTFSADIYDDGVSSTIRNTAGLRRASGANLIEMGMYNSPSHYVFRVILFGPGDPGWVAFDNLVDDSGFAIDNAPITGWHRFVAEITASSISFSLDLNSDGIINATSVVAIDPTDLGFDVVRLGGPSDLSSTAGGASFDNIRLELSSVSTTVPAPSTFALVALLATFGVARRRGSKITSNWGQSEQLGSE